MNALRRSLVSVAALVALGASPVLATTFGSLANFDTVNDTGQSAHGFEIELDDLHRADVLDVFGLNRNFGTPSPGDVERYGLPTVIEDLIPGTTRPRVTIRYQAAFSGGVWSATTLSGVFNTPGESCWKFGNVGYPNVPCDHFGVSTRGAPSATVYNWLVDSGTPGVLTQASVKVPAVQFTPPTPAAPLVMVAIPAPPLPAVPPPPQDTAYWVKIIMTTLPDKVDVNDLMAGHNPFENPGVALLGDKAETEYEWQALQPGKVDEVTKSLDLAGNPSMVIRLEFFKYQGTFDNAGFVDPQPSDYLPGGKVPLGSTVGAYVGEQIAGFNAQAVPEASTWAMLLIGLGGLGWIGRVRGQVPSREAALA